MKHCIDCKNWDLGRCVRAREENPVTGVMMGPWAYEERDSSDRGRCGLIGRHFEPISHSWIIRPAVWLSVGLAVGVVAKYVFVVWAG